MAQITEDFCSFELSKLLKEKGFNEVCSSYYITGGINDKGEITTNFHNYGETFTINFNDYTNELYSYLEYYSAPTLQMAMKWLREVHGLFISIEPCFDYELKYVVYLAFIQNVTDIDVFQEGRVEVASGYIVEAVYGKALKYCLENLI